MSTVAAPAAVQRQDVNGAQSLEHQGSRRGILTREDSGLRAGRLEVIQI